MTSGRSRAGLALGGVLALALAVRLAHHVALVRSNLLRVIPVYADMGAYWGWAQAILAGDVLGRNTFHPHFPWMDAIAPMDTWYRWWGGQAIFHQAPLYPYLVAALLAVSDRSLAFALATQLALGVLHVGLVFWLARRVFARTLPAAVAAGLVALYGPLVAMQGLLLRDWLVPLVDTLALAALLCARDDGRGRAWLLAGVGLGLSWVTKPVILLFLPLALAWVGLEYRHAWRRAGRAWGLVGLGCLAVLAPVIARNVVVGAPPLAVETRGPEAFIIGNAADGDPIGFFRVPASMQAILKDSDAHFLPVVRETLRTFDGVGEFLTFQLRKLRALLDPEEFPNSDDVDYVESVSPVLEATVGFGVLLPLGLAGIALGWPWSSRQRLLLLYFVATLVGLWLAPIRTRYRLALVPPLAVFGGLIVATLVDALRARRFAWVARGTALVVVLALVQQLALQPSIVDAGLVQSTQGFWAARFYADEGKLGLAVEQMVNLGTRARRRGWRHLADRARVVEGDFRTAWAQQILKEGRAGEARQQLALVESCYTGPDLPSYIHINLAGLYQELGDLAQARQAYRRFLELEPAGQRADLVRRRLATLGE